MVEIIPSIIPQNLQLAKERMEEVLGLTKKIQLDVVDGKFAPNLTWPFADGSNDLMRFSRGEEKFPHIDDFLVEVDMMVLHPIEYLSDFISMGAKSVIIHIESTDHVKECLETAKNSGCRAGLALKPSSDSELLEPYVFQIDFVQFMGNDKIGYSGVELDKAVYEKIKNFHERHPSVPVQADIGVSEETIPKLKEAGVSSFICGSSIFNAPDVKEAIAKLQKY